MGSEPDRHIIGLISDTHGLLRPEVFEALAGVELIFHAGDVGGDDILDELGAIAPVYAVFGNTDPTDNPRLSPQVVRAIGGVTIHVSHGHELGMPVPAKLLAAYAQDVIVYGHTHRQMVVRAENRLVVNPGAAGPRRFKVEASVALLTVVDGRAEVEIVAL
ncbi:MAG: metallophosphatase family protein [Gemmatimonadota bacterium]|nr:metallophosphatase family protein [Gemmatimonadota bacterium]